MDACPRCGQALHDEPVAIDHALRLGLVCTDHGIVSIADPLADVQHQQEKHRSIGK